MKKLKQTLSRRQFLDMVFKTGCGSCLATIPLMAGNHEKWRKEAAYYSRLEDKKVRCDLCPNECIIKEGKRGICRVRENRSGTLFTLVYGRLCSMNIDPVEKKPLYHFLPGSQSLSIATAGCNVHCKFCQNWTIAQSSPEDIRYQYYSPENLIKTAKQYAVPIIAFTYSEPVIFYEYMLDVAKLAKKNNIKTVMITNGYINPAPLQELCRYISAIKVDFKGYSEEFYRTIVRGRLRPVLHTMQSIHENDVWLEIVNLVIPTYNDSDEDLNRLCHWIISNLDTHVPVHFSGFQPQYLMKNLPPTPTKTLEKAYQLAKAAGINHVYLGNIPQKTTDDTYCPECDQLIIERRGYVIQDNHLKDGRCPNCEEEIAGVWE
ncbi:MAG: AmmeMemoRadiSam system radical SAM enzyme [Fidelibacterota bacterium]